MTKQLLTGKIKFSFICGNGGGSEKMCGGGGEERPGKGL